MRIRLALRLTACAVAGALVLFVVTQSTSGDGDENEKLRKEVAQAVQSQLMDDLQPVYKFYQDGLATRDLLCVPKGMKVPDEFRLKRGELLKEPHKTRYSVISLPNAAYDINCHGFRLMTRFRSPQEIVISAEKAYVLASGVAALSASTLKIHTDGEAPEGYEIFTCLSKVTAYISLPTDPYAHFTAALLDIKPTRIRRFGYGWDSKWKETPEEGKKLLKATITKCRRNLDETAKKGYILRAFEKANAGDDVSKIYGNPKEDDLDKDATISQNPGAILELWFDLETDTTSANAIADIRCLVELKRDPETKKWKVEKMWLLSELEVPKKPEPPAGDK